MGLSINLNKSYQNGNRNVLIAVLFYFISFHFLFYFFYFCLFVCFFLFIYLFIVYLFMWYWLNISVHYWKLCKTNAKQKRHFANTINDPCSPQYISEIREHPGSTPMKVIHISAIFAQARVYSRSLKVQHYRSQTVNCIHTVDLQWINIKAHYDTLDSDNSLSAISCSGFTLQII